MAYRPRLLIGRDGKAALACGWLSHCGDLQLFTRIDVSIVDHNVEVATPLAARQGQYECRAAALGASLTVANSEGDGASSSGTTAVPSRCK